MREATTARRVPSQSVQEPAQVEDSDDEDTSETLAIPTFAIPNAQHRTPPEGTLEIPDPIETYVRSLLTGTIPDPDRLVVACENSAVRSIFTLVDNNSRKECI